MLITKTFTRYILVYIIIIFVANSVQAQSTILKLPSNDQTSSFDITKNNNSNVLRLFGDGGFYVTGTFNSGAIPVSGAGLRLMWYSRKGAFRAGEVTGGQWDNASVGFYSAAMGYNTTASGLTSFAMGTGSTASGDYSATFGLNCSAAHTSFSAGQFASAAGGASIALGSNVTASGGNSAAIGFASTASGSASAAIGSYVSTNGFSGAFIFGDNSSLSTEHSSSAANQMTMRFAGGYRLFTNSLFTIGASLAANGNSWSTISDSTKKENYIKADGESFLNYLSGLKLGSWNYKAQDKSIRHYGPMAQEIYRYFGKDELGIIGNDTTLATADMDGIIMICLQALEKRTTELKEAAQKISHLEKIITTQTEQNTNQSAAVDELKKELDDMKLIVAALLKGNGSNNNLAGK